MKTIKILKYTFLLIFVASVTACKDGLLDGTPLASISPSNFYQNEAQCESGLMGVYSCLRPTGPQTQFFQYDNMSDNNCCTAAWQGSQEIARWQTNSSSVAPSYKWRKDYQMIVRANEFLKSMETATASDDVKKVMIGEAKFLRAWAYADLITYFGDVPLILEPQALENADVPRTAKVDVLETILKDYDDAIAVLPVIQTETGRATKGAAYAMKARILLYNEKWEEAAMACKSVMDLNAYDLFPDYENLFKEAYENNIEVIFDIQYKDPFVQPTPSSRLALAEYSSSSVTADMINSYYMTNGKPVTDPSSGYDAQNPYVNRDPRMDASVVLPGSTRWLTERFIPAESKDLLCGVRSRKYADLEGKDGNKCSLNTILMRYADVLLIRAEALVESGNTGEEVYNLIDKVRRRVDMPDVEDVEGTGLSQGDLRKIIRHERRVEFFMEGTRYEDMLRWKDESLVHDAYGYVGSKLSDPNDPSKWVFETEKKDTRKFDSSKGWLWPVPLTEMQNNPKLKQNPGY